ncbi:MAG: hypothetical protein OXI96_05850 [Acidimicrobiaceae bacterium]|nr:hypothetical protein [Acidimicrobiaceae bacterium]
MRNEVEMLRNEVNMVRKDIEMVENRLNTKIGRVNAKMDAGFKEIRSEIAFGFSEQNNRLAQQTK